MLVVNGSIFTFEEKVEENAFCILSYQMDLVKIDYFHLFGV